MVSHPNIFAMYMELIIPFLLAQFLYINNMRWKRILVFAVMVILVLALVITFSRGAWFATIIGAFLVLWCLNGRKAVFWTAAVLPVLLFSSTAIYKRFLSSFDLTMQSNIERIHGLISSFKIILDYPLTGVGLGCYKLFYPTYKLPLAKEILPHAHNTLMVFATEAGVFTAAAFFGFIILLIKSLYLNIRQNIRQNNCHNEHYYLVMGMSGGILALMLHGFVDYTLGNQGVLGIFMLYIGFLLGLIEKNDNIKKAHN
ncbi:O-antigen ligase like membrane protein [Sporolituus thermophilus DSM 23256]|uniref:O-antigen ligase like membrane protein n=2 Tax=Sporolituus TaxID=909931 RepID=A0A1G7NG35_9FIRM|nr:O-antigen ligase like membrane protein [Sporolituus thermophilus DSM 23256]